ncbi:MAG: DUF3106 domain-containing protein [Terracidiphilus sp.]
MSRAALAAAIALLCVSTAWARGQHEGAPAPRQAGGPAMHADGPRPRNARPQPARRQPYRPQYQNRPGQQIPGRQQGNLMQSPAPGYATPGLRPGNPGSAPGQVYSRPIYPAVPYITPARPIHVYPGAAPPGHLGDWLNQHRDLPVQEQERMLRGDPSFYRLPPADQQRLLQQLHQVNQMPEEQRQRRLARAEALEHMTPQERMSLNLSGRRLANLPPDRQVLVKRAFRDLRSVPLDQRQTVLNSSRYQGVFSPEERGILTDFLRAEPYEPAQ